MLGRAVWRTWKLLFALLRLVPPARNIPPLIWCRSKETRTEMGKFVLILPTAITRAHTPLRNCLLLRFLAAPAHWLFSGGHLPPFPVPWWLRSAVQVRSRSRSKRNRFLRHGTHPLTHIPTTPPFPFSTPFSLPMYRVQARYLVGLAHPPPIPLSVSFPVRSAGLLQPSQCTSQGNRVHTGSLVVCSRHCL